MTGFISTACIALVLFALLISWIGWLHTRSFQKNFDSIRNNNDIEQFKDAVKVNMYVALAMLVGIVISALLAIVGVMIGELNLLTVSISLVGVGLLFSIGGVVHSATEKRIREMPIADEELREEFDRIVKQWRYKAFPNW